MTFPYAEDAAGIFEGGDFDAAVYTPLGGGSTSVVYGMFDAAYADPLGIEASYPRFTCAATAVVGIRHGATLLIGTTTYKVFGVEPDSIGSVMLKLQEQ